jgi:uncharacterized protein (DUF1697 family)
MASIVFLKGVNVGGHRTFRPSLLASEMAELGVMNIGAAGTFVVWKSNNQAKLRQEFLRRLPFETEVRVCSANDVLRLAAARPFVSEPSGSDIVRFVSVLPKQPRVPPALPINLPAGENWLVRLVKIRGRFAFGLYRRNMQTIRLLGQIEKHLGGSVTTRNWNTFSNLFEILKTKQQSPHPRTARSNNRQRNHPNQQRDEDRKSSYRRQQRGRTRRPENYR